MSKGMAVAIFKDIYTQVATEEEKMESIKMVLSMETHNGIRKQDFINVLRYLMGRMEKQENKWIPVDERLPENGDYILLSFTNFSSPLIGRYEEDPEGGAFYLGDCDEEDTCISMNLFVNAWLPLPESYRPEKDN